MLSIDGSLHASLEVVFQMECEYMGCRKTTMVAVSMRVLNGTSDNKQALWVKLGFRSKWMKW